MKKQNLLQAICILPLIILSGCTKDDNEPMPQSTVSRLYVSNADTDASVSNTLIYDPADQSKFKEPYKFISLLPDANGIFFDPYSGTVFQVSRKNKNIKTFEVKTDGSLANKNSFIDEGLTSAREMAFNRILDILYVASNADSAIYVYEKASTLKGTVSASKKLKLNGQPWGIHLDNDRLFVVIDQGRAEVQLFEGASALVVGTIIPTKKNNSNRSYQPSWDHLFAGTGCIDINGYWRAGITRIRFRRICLYYCRCKCQLYCRYCSYPFPNHKRE